MRGQRGAALVFVLALLTVIGILVGLAWRLMRTNNALSAMNRGEAQARLLALSGADYALSRIGPPGPRQDLDYATEGLEYRLDDSDRVFNLTVRTHGLFARVQSLGRTSLPAPGRAHAYAGLIGQAMDLGRLPALGLLNQEGNVVLAGKAEVSGPVMLWRGDVRKATDYHVRWEGGAGHAGPVWDSAAPAWKRCEIDFQRADKWMAEQSAMLASGDFGRDGDYDSGTVEDLLLPDSALLTDTLMADTRVRARRVLRVGSGARLMDCKLLSERIIIEAGADLDRVLVYAGRTLDVKGGRIRGGQYLAGDSLRIASDGPLTGYPVFYAQGRMRNRGRADSAMVGALILKKAKGEGLFFSAAREHPPFDQDIRLAVEPGVRVRGLLFTTGYARMEGNLIGSLICHNLKFEYKGTIWLGHLKEAQLTALKPGQRIPAPLLFPGLFPAAFAGRGP
jgi:hypothetical protein